MKLKNTKKSNILTILSVIIITLAPPVFADGEVENEKNDAGLTIKSYHKKNIQGWKFYIQKTALTSPKLKTVTNDIEAQLIKIKSSLPQSIVSKLQKVPVWINKDIRNGACYHPSVEWLIENKRMPEKARSIEFQSLDSFIETADTQPMVMLHELAHAFHHRVHNDNSPTITKAFEKAVKSKSYEKVKHISGGIMKHYALSNEQEYFAEASEAYFGKNDYYPFTRAELKKHDPAAYAMVEKMWKVRAISTTTKQKTKNKIRFCSKKSSFVNPLPRIPILSFYLR